MNAPLPTNRSSSTRPLAAPSTPLPGVRLGVLLAGSLTVLLTLVPVGQAQADPEDATSSATAAAEAHVEVPELPFDDNPDPDQCGIPQPLGDDVRGTVDGRWEGETLFPDVHLYDSHLRSRVTGTIPTGSRVRVEMFQNNPVLNYWYVRWDGPDGTVQGWIPAPFLTVER